MRLSELRIHNFRCLVAEGLQPEAGINLIVGDNASGKSSLLEAIYFLGRAQSFRGTPRDRLIRTDQRELSVFGRMQNGSGTPTTIGVLRSNRQSQIRLNAQDNTSILELIAALPIQVIDPRLHQLLEEGPDQRRRFLDWGVFHVEPAFYPAWQRYQRALRQRNQLLRHAAPATEVCLWNGELVQQALLLDRARRHYLEQMQAVLPGIMQGLFENAEVEIEYQHGWPADQPLEQVLAENLVRDREQGFTQAGPHRADLKIRLHGKQARTRASRGEQKLISAGMLLAQAEIMRRHQARHPILLIDDLAAELDARSRRQLFDAIQASGAQAFLTFLEAAQIPQTQAPKAMFHVEHGRVKRTS
jgi:DNA replication and repair protein RecF